MTYSDFINSYGFKHASKLAKKKFPWITKIEVDPNTYHLYKNIIYLRVYINPTVFEENMGNSGSVIPTWNSEFGWDSLHIIFEDITSQQSREINREISRIFQKVEKNDAIPRQVNIPRKDITVDAYFIDFD